MTRSYDKVLSSTFRCYLVVHAIHIRLYVCLGRTIFCLLQSSTFAYLTQSTLSFFLTSPNVRAFGPSRCIGLADCLFASAHSSKMKGKQ